MITMSLWDTTYYSTKSKINEINENLSSTHRLLRYYLPLGNLEGFPRLPELGKTVERKVNQ